LVIGSWNLEILNCMFHLLKQSQINNGRIGEVVTNHGTFQTPVFMPPATYGAVKSLAISDLEELGIDIILVNALHLYLRTPPLLIKKFKGIHHFMGFKKAILSDSGGFQAWSFQKKQSLSKISNEGIHFISPFDGSRHFLTPKKAIEIQHQLGVDILMALDECSPDNSDKDYIKKALKRTNQWALESLKAHQELAKKEEKPPLIFGIIQGGPFIDLRKEAAKFIADLPFDGIALGGETIGYNMEKTLEIIEEVKPLLKEDKPLYTMGLGGKPTDIIEVTKRGVDMFDCVNPLRLARHGELFHGKIMKDKKEVKIESEFKEGILKISQSRFKNDKKPIDESCNCYTCSNFSRAYLRYLYLLKEPLYLRLASIHNLNYIKRLIEVIKSNF